MSAEDPLSWQRKGRAGHADPPPLPQARRNASDIGIAERVRIARGYPQAVVRVLSYRSGHDAVRRTLAYVTSKSEGRFVVEGDVEVEGAESQRTLLRDWMRDFGMRAGGRDVVHLELSAPPDSDRDSVFAAARAFAAGTFGATHQYALAEHRDTAHPHCHLVLKLRGYNGRALDPRKSDLARWRAAFAACARDQGLALASSPRAERAAPRVHVSRAIVALRRRGIIVEQDRAGRAPAGERADWRRAEVSRAFERDAARLLKAAREASAPGEAERLERMAADLQSFASKARAPTQVSASTAAPRRRVEEREIER